MTEVLQTADEREMPEIKRYDELVKGEVQRSGFRSYIQTIGRELDLRGYVYNENGSVRIVWEGVANVEKFEDSIKRYPYVIIEDIEREGIPRYGHLPYPFCLISGGIEAIEDTAAEGVRILRSMDEKLGNMGGKMDSIGGKMDTHTEILGSMNEKVGGIDTTLDSHTKVLESTNEKLDGYI